MFDKLMGDIYTCFIDKDRYLEIVRGLGNTLIITFFALLIGIVIGLIVALCKVSAEKNKKLKFLDVIANVYLTVIRGTPVVQIGRASCRERV